MAFFDNLGKKASETTAKAMQKAQELSEISRLNSLISDEEKKINAAYLEIGKLYVSVHSSDSEDNFSGMVAAVLEGTNKIAEYKKQIQNVKGIQRCEKCGAEVPKGVAFCSSCGAAMPKEEPVLPAGTIRCANCGALVKSDMRFCTSCGKPVEQPAPSADTPEEQAAEKFCPSCGAKVEGDTTFCTKCGMKL